MTRHLKPTLGFVLAFSLAGLQLIAVAAIIISSYISSERVLLEHARNLLSDVASDTIAHSEDFLRPAEGAADLARRLAENEIVSSDNRELLEKLLFQQLKTAPQFAGLFYGDEQGNFVYVMRTGEEDRPFRTKIVTRDGEDRETELIWRDDQFATIEAAPDKADTYDPRARPWYIAASENDANAWTDPYIFFSSQRPGITISSPVKNNAGEFIGAIGVDIEIIAISSFLADLQIGEQGRALIINQNGDVIAHPDATLLTSEAAGGLAQFPMITDVEDPVAREAFSGLYEDGALNITAETASSVTHNGERFVATAVPITDGYLPWTIAVYAPEADFIGPIKANRLRNFGIAILFAILTAAIGLHLARRIKAPITLLGSRAADIAKNLPVRSDRFPDTFPEIKQAHDTMMAAVQQRRKSDVIHEQTFHDSQRAMARVDPHTGRIMRYNPALCSMLGRRPEDVSGRNLDEVLDPGGDRIPAETWKSLIAGDGGLIEEIRALRADATDIWLSANMIAVHDDQGAPLHTVVTLDDISRVKEAELEVRRLNAELAHFARINVMGHMATGLAHELNQPLAAIIQNTDAALLTLEQANRDPEILREILGDLDELAHRAGGIIKALRDFVRKDEAERTRFDLADLVKQTVTLMAPEAKEHDITIKVDGRCRHPVVAIRVQIAQVLVNLIRNSIEAFASERASGDPQALATITVRLEDTEAGTQINVIDTGPGPADASALFCQFQTTKATGMGIGLSISKVIVENHGGTIWCARATAGDTCFSFSLPLAETERKAA